MTDAPTRRLLGRRRPARRSGGGDDAPRPADAPERGRDEADTFLAEVDEELRRDRMYAAARRYGPFVIGAIVLLVGFTAWREAAIASRDAGAREAGAAVLTALRSDDPPTALIDAAETLGDGGAAALARLSAAGALMDEGELVDAARQYALVAADESLPQVFRDLARLKGAMAIFDDSDPERMLAELAEIAEPGRPFRPLALELQAAAHLQLGDVDAARYALQTVIEAGEGPQSLQRRLEATLEALGGALSPERRAEVARAVLLGLRASGPDAPAQDDASAEDEAGEDAPVDDGEADPPAEDGSDSDDADAAGGDAAE